MPLEHKWLRFAEEDLKMAELAIDAQLWNQACFHSQQAAEKYLKATWTDAEVPRIHKISELLSLSTIEIPESLAEDLILLDRFYIPTRYPDAIPGSVESGLPDHNDALEALRVANDLRQYLEI